MIDFAICQQVSVYFTTFFPFLTPWIFFLFLVQGARAQVQGTRAPTISCKTEGISSIDDVLCTFDSTTSSLLFVHASCFLFQPTTLFKPARCTFAIYIHYLYCWAQKNMFVKGLKISYKICLQIGNSSLWTTCWLLLIV